MRKKEEWGKGSLEGQEFTHVRSLRGVFTLKDIPQHINRGIGLDRNTSLHTLFVNVANQLLGACAGGGFFIGGIGRGNGGDRSFVVETVQVATGVLELTNPFVWLSMSRYCQ
jgi:hypothetical protein